jgi:single-stranded-DNA-specific exonuclease
MKRWNYRDCDTAAAEIIQAELGVNRLLALLLTQRNIRDLGTAQRFLNPKLDDLHDPYLMLGMRPAVERIRQAIAKREGILIYGDYDVDGTSSIALMRATIELAGGSTSFHVPHRVQDGYGMRAEVVEQAARENVRLIISVDTGIRENAVVERATELGIDSIVTDHHLPDKVTPPALAVLNPNQLSCSYPDKNLCGVGVAFKLAHALLSVLGWPQEKLTRVIVSLLKLVAIGTIADVVPLIGENRIFVKFGLEGLRDPRNLGLKALLDVAGFSSASPPSAGSVAFRVAPRINAAGRMDTAREVVELFATDDPLRASNIATKLDRLNTDRQRAEEVALREIYKRLRGIPTPPQLPVIVEVGEGWHAGVIGIVASRIAEQFHRPTLVLTSACEKGTVIGSARSIPNFHLLEAFESVADLFQRFGGHRQAAGCTLPIEHVPELRRRLNEYAHHRLQKEDFVPTLQLDVELPFSSIQDEIMTELRRLAPHGLANPSPRFSTPDLGLVATPRIFKEKHLELRLSSGDKSINAVGWGMAARGRELSCHDRLNVAYSVERDTYAGGWRLTLEDFHAVGT